MPDTRSGTLTTIALHWAVPVLERSRTQSPGYSLDTSVAVQPARSHRRP